MGQPRAAEMQERGQGAHSLRPRARQKDHPNFDFLVRPVHHPWVRRCLEEEYRSEPRPPGRRWEQRRCLEEECRPEPHPPGRRWEGRHCLEEECHRHHYRALR